MSLSIFNFTVQILTLTYIVKTTKLIISPKRQVNFISPTQTQKQKQNKIKIVSWLLQQSFWVHVVITAVELPSEQKHRRKMGPTPNPLNDRSQSKKRKTTILSLEHDILCMIFTLLDFFDLVRCSAVCKYWYFPLLSLSLSLPLWIFFF